MTSLKTTLLVLIIVFTPKLFSQKDSFNIDVVAYWDLNEEHEYDVSKIEKRWENDSLIKYDSISYKANFKVLDSSSVHYTIRWKFEDYVKNIFLGTSNNSFRIQSKIGDILKDYDLSYIDYKTDELGTFLEIVNWERYGEAMNRVSKEIITEAQENYPEKAERIAKAMQPMVEIFASKEGIEQLILLELQLFHFPFGTRYRIDEPISYEQEFPNLLGGDPINGEAVLSITEYDSENLYCTIQEESKIDPKGTKDMLADLFEKMGMVDSELGQILKDSKLNIVDLNLYHYYYYPGLPKKIEAKRSFEVKIPNYDLKAIKKTTISIR